METPKVKGPRPPGRGAVARGVRGAQEHWNSHHQESWYWGCCQQGAGEGRWERKEGGWARKSLREGWVKRRIKPSEAPCRNALRKEKEKKT